MAPAAATESVQPGTGSLFEDMIIGKVVLEKILRSLPEVKKIYVLVRLKVYNMKTTGIERGFADGTDQKRNI